MNTFLIANNVKQTSAMALLKSNESLVFKTLPFGYRSISNKTPPFTPGFNGERSDPFSGLYHLGNGYRAYNPILMRFNCPDSLSPFGEGGVNPYAYCFGDPINKSDPSGHSPSGGAWIGLGLSVLGLIFTGVGIGLAISAAGGVIAGLSAFSASTIITAGLTVLVDTIGIVSSFADIFEWGSDDWSTPLKFLSIAFGAMGFLSGGFFSLKINHLLKTAKAIPQASTRAHFSAQFNRTNREPHVGFHQETNYTAGTSGPSPMPNSSSRNSPARQNPQTPSKQKTVIDGNLFLRSERSYQREHSGTFIKSILENKNNPKAMFRNSLSSNEIKKVKLILHPDKNAGNLELLAKEAFSVFTDNWQSVLLRRNSSTSI